jgi:apolipoprotein N-acyltransferase
LPGLPLVGPLICFEAIFPGDVVDKSRRPEWLLNLTNDAWYGNSAGPYQHLVQTKFRSVEEGLPLIRAANTGISAVIDAYGRVVATLGLGETGVLDTGLPMPLIGPTFYSQHGNIPILFFVVLLVVVTLVGGAQRSEIDE